MRRLYLSARARLGVALGVASLASIGLYTIWIGGGEPPFTYLIGNLFLAWAALFITLWLERTLRHSLWSSWYALGLTFLWLVFLPNTFYMVTDFIHLHELQRGELLTGTVMFTSFILNALVLGLLSVSIVHHELIKRVRKRTAVLLVGLVLLLASFAIYVGRELRWSTWDIVTNPTSVLFDISERLLNAGRYPRMFEVTIGFFVLLATLYGVLWQMARMVRSQREL